MIETLEIKNFKSIERLKLYCRRVNVFIGEPNTGKSNILEALGLISYVGHASGENDLPDFVRCDNIINLFRNGDLDEPLKIVTDDTLSLNLSYQNGRFEGWVGLEYVSDANGYTLRDSNGLLEVESFSSRYNPQFRSLNYDNNTRQLSKSVEEEGIRFKFYRFAHRTTFPNKRPGSLAPPSGSNLLAILATNPDVAEIASIIYGTRELRLNMRAHEDKLEVVRDLEFVLSSDPYHLTSDTFQRVVFHMAALESNSDACIVFEEPEAHAFPYHTKYLAERIALDERGNQFFISTHNPYFLLPLIQKTTTKEIQVFITSYEDYKTKVTPLKPEDHGSILGEIDVFSNIDLFLEDE